MPNANDINPSENISLLLKGSPGVGKTIAASSFAMYGKVWLAYWDKNSPIELLTFYRRIGRQDILKNIDYDVYSAVNANEFLNKLYRIQQEPGKYVAGINDSLTMMTTGSVGWSIGFRSSQGAKKDTVNKQSTQIIPGFDEYKVETGIATQSLDLMKSIPWYNIWTAHPLPKLKVEGGQTAGSVGSITQTETLVSYGNKVGALIPGSFTEVYHFGFQNAKRTIYTKQFGSDFAKTALNLPPYFELPDDALFAEIWKSLVNESLSKLEATDEVNTLSFPTQSKWKV